MIEQLKAISSILKDEVYFYKLISEDKRVPKISKIFISSAIFYFLLPFDLIPDFIPVIGHIDDLIIIPLLIYVAVKFVPADVMREARQKAESRRRG